MTAYKRSDCRCSDLHPFVHPSQEPQIGLRARLPPPGRAGPSFFQGRLYSGAPVRPESKADIRHLTLLAATNRAAQSQCFLRCGNHPAFRLRLCRPSRARGVLRSPACLPPRAGRL